MILASHPTEAVPVAGCVCSECCPKHLQALRDLIGQPPKGSHPDDWKPRAATWHKERLNWDAEVRRLRAALISSPATPPTDAGGTKPTSPAPATATEERKAVAELKEALWKHYPNEGAWETQCPYCFNQTGAGKVSHSDDCPLILIEKLSPQPSATDEQMADDVVERFAQLLASTHDFMLYPTECETLSQLVLSAIQEAKRQE